MILCLSDNFSKKVPANDFASGSDPLMALRPSSLAKTELDSIFETMSFSEAMPLHRSYKKHHAEN